MKTNIKRQLAHALTAAAVATAFGLSANAAAVTAIYCDAASVEDLQKQIINLSQQANGIKARAEAEKRELTDGERDELDRIFEAFDSVEVRLKMAEARQRNQTQAHLGPDGGGRRTDADGFSNAHTTRAQLDAAGGRQRASVPAQPKGREHGMGGFDGAGTFLQAVMAASARGGPVDPRLISNAPTTFGQEAVGADGGFAVPPDFRSTIVQKVMGEDSLLKLTDQWTTASNSITVPVDETTPWQTSGGIQAYWESEAGQKQQSKPKLGQVTVKANKIISLVPLTDELLEDAVSMGNYVNKKAPEKIDFKVTDAIINGAGGDRPLGILSSGGLVTVDAESGQAADTVVYANIANMWGRMYSPARRGAVWLMNADAESQLQFMAFPVQSGTTVPVYLPPGGLSGSPYSTLYGRPIITSEAMPALGDAGDVVLANLDQYMSLVKTVGLRQDVSIHIWFDYDVTAFRFVLRVGGQPWWNAPITRLNGPSRSAFVALGARAG